MKKQFFFFALMSMFAATVITSCGKDEMDVKLTEVTEKKGDVTITVRDANSGEVLDDVTLTLADGTSATTANGGVAAFTQLVVGNHKVTLSKSGYASTLETVNVIDHGVNALFLSLHKTGAKVTGIAVVSKEDDSKIPAFGATLQIAINGSFIQRIYTTTVDADGSYTFTDLPEKVGYNYLSFSVKDLKVGSDTYSLPSYSVPSLGTLPEAGKTTNLSTITYYIDKSNLGSFAVIELTATVKKTDKIVIKFSQPVDIDNSSDISFRGEIAQWSNNNKTATITPPATGWDYSSSLNGSTIRDINGRTLESPSLSSYYITVE